MALPPPPPVPPPPAPRRLSRRKKLLFALVPLAVLLVAGELFCRGLRRDRGLSPFASANFRDQRIDLIRRGYPAAHDPLLGYVPRPGFRSADNPWRAEVTIDALGLRQNGPLPTPPDQPGLLAVGDSFTFGDQVGDADTWPAALAARLQQPVWNGGVFGYSFAQTVLRAEQLLDRLPVRGLVVSLISDDLKRCELSKRFTPVPWYDLRDGELVLQGVPVPDTARGTREDGQWLRQLLGYSALCDTVFWNSVPKWWVATEREVAAHPPGTGLAIGCRLLDRLAARCARDRLPLLLVLQGEVTDASGPGLLAHAAGLGIATLDLVAEFLARQQEDPGTRGRLFQGHMAAAGNHWVAERIAAVWPGVVPPPAGPRSAPAGR